MRVKMIRLITWCLLIAAALFWVLALCTGERIYPLLGSVTSLLATVAYVYSSRIK